MNRLPNFLYIGPDKAGSSWLHETLIQHPRGLPDPGQGPLLLRPLLRPRPGVVRRAVPRRPSRARVVGEICQDYLFDPRAARGSHSTLPGERLDDGVAARPGGAGLVLLALRPQARRSARGLPDRPAHRARAPGARPVRHGPGPLHRALPGLGDPHRASSTTWPPTRRPSWTRPPTSSGSTGSRWTRRSGRPGWRPAGPVAVASPTPCAAAADLVREHDGARVVGRVKRSPWSSACSTGRSTARRSVPRPTTCSPYAPPWRRRSTPSSARSASGSASPGAGSGPRAPLGPVRARWKRVRVTRSDHLKPAAVTCSGNQALLFVRRSPASGLAFR